MHLSLILIVLLYVQTSLVISFKCPGTTNECSLHGTCYRKAEKYICKCEWGWSKDDCSEKLCPRGFDVLKKETEEDSKIRFTTSAAAGKIAGTLIIGFHDHVIEIEAGSDALTSDTCTKSFKRFQTFQDLECKLLERNDKNGAAYEITFKSFPTYPIMNNLFHHDGNPSGNDFQCDTSKITSGSYVSCKFENIASSNYRKYVPCSNHGTCDTRTGRCTCERGFYGDNCASNHDADVYISKTAESPFYSGVFLDLKSSRSKSSEFSFVNFAAGNRPVFTMSGLGESILHTGDFIISDGSQTIRDGELKVHGPVHVVDSSLQVNGGSFEVRRENLDINVASISGSIKSNTKADRSILFLKALTNANDKPDIPTSIISCNLNDETLFSVDTSGKTIIRGKGVDVSGGGIRTNGTIEALGGIETSQKIEMMNGNLVINDGVIQLRSTEDKAPALSIEKSGFPSINGVLNIRSTVSDPNSVDFLLIKAESSDQTMFEVWNTGKTIIRAGGLKIAGGGLEIDSGGQTIASGGLNIISGGLKVQSGGITIENDIFEVTDGGFKVGSSIENRPSLHVVVKNENFAGAALFIEAEKVVNSQYNFISAKTVDSEIFSVSSDGVVKSSGGFESLGGGDIVSSGDLIIKKRAVVDSIRIVAGPKIVLPCTHSYIRVLDDGKVSENYAEFDSSKATIGQILYVQNMDAEGLINVAVPSHSIASFVFDGEGWHSVTATSFDTSKIHKVEEFTAVADLHVGNVKITAKDLQAGSQLATHVAYYGRGGLLSGDETFTYSDSTLRVPSLEVSRMMGRTDLSESELTDVTILRGSISNVNLSADTIRGSGEIHIASNAFIGGGMTVNGQVMGSGSYIDISDKRFKKDIHSIEKPMESIRRLCGVHYSFKTDEYPEKNFAKSKQTGFIAQEVAEALPHVVTSDSKGYLHIAYSQIIPVVVEGIKAQDEEIKSLNEVIIDQKQALNLLISKMEKLEKKVDEMREDNAKLIEKLLNSKKDIFTINR